MSEIINNQMSIYIPRVDTRCIPNLYRATTSEEYEDIIKEFIAEQFHQKHIGNVNRVDLLDKVTPQGYTYFIAFVHFETWYEDMTSAILLQRDIKDQDKKATLQINNKWYWIVNENKNPLTKTEAELHAIIHKQEQQIAELTKQLQVFIRPPLPLMPYPPHLKLSQDDFPPLDKR
jgi:hypothetical protein